MHLLEPAVKPYDWGSHRMIAELQGRPSPTPGPEADPSNHVIAGDILSPSLTGPVTERILGWIDTLPGADGG